MTLEDTIFPQRMHVGMGKNWLQEMVNSPQPDTIYISRDSFPVKPLTESSSHLLPRLLGIISSGNIF